jgi:secreted PhoX family phosphatase
MACRGSSGSLTLGDTEDSVSTTETPELEKTLRFADVGFPETEEERHAVRSTQQVWIDGKASDVDYHVIMRSGDSPDGQGVFGRLVDEHGAPLLDAEGIEYVSPRLDFSSLQQTGSGAIVSITHVESNPGALYRTEIDQDAESGLLTATSTRPLDLSDMAGIYLPCAASITPWGTHLGGEEYPPDARRWERATGWMDLETNTRSFVRYWGHDVLTDENEDNIPDNIDMDELRRDFLPYRYGFPFEVTITETSADVARHRSMGRTSTELALVMPDRRTAYISEDESNAAFYLFIADTDADLSAGTLYAMVWSQTSDEGAGEADLSWISLGHATDAQVDQLIANGITFSDIFQHAIQEFDQEGLPTFQCSKGYTGVNTWVGFECLALNEGMELAASRLETNRYAAYIGATTELKKGEGLTYDPDRNRLYFAVSTIVQGMEDEIGGYDLGGNNHIRLQKNECGVVYAMDLGPNGEMGSDYVAQNIRALLRGTPTVYDTGSEYAGNECGITEIASPDNIYYIAEYQVLVIAEDTREQQNDSVWAYDLQTGVLDRIMTAPFGAENTSVYLYTGINGWAYLKNVVHGPYGEPGLPGPENEDDVRAYDGYIGPMRDLAP